MFVRAAVIWCIIAMLGGCSSLFFTPKQDIQLLIEPSDIDYRCFQTNKDEIVCRRISE